MKQIVQPLAGGPVEVLDVPRPVPDPTEVLVRTVASVISPGTERAVTALAQSSLLAKARARPDLVRQVVRKARADGFAATRHAVRSRLAEDLPLGYSAAGIVLEAGAAVTGVRPGQLVATGGAGKANHAEFQAVPGLLCATVPDGVPAGDAAFTTIAAIALHGLRLAEAGPGSKVVVLGLGLIGQLAARLALAAGCEVAGIDPAEHRAPRGGRLRGAGPGRVRRRHHGPGAQLVAGPGRGCRAGLRGRAVLGRGDAGARALPGPGRGRDRGRRRPPAEPDPVLRAGAVAAVRPVLRPRALRALVRGVGRGLPGRPGAVDRGAQLRGGPRPAGQRPAAGRGPGHAHASGSPRRTPPTG